MSDILSSVIEAPAEMHFQPEAPLATLPAPNFYVPDFNKPVSSGATESDPIAKIMNSLDGQKPSWEEQSAPTTWDADGVNLDVYKNTDNFQRYGYNPAADNNETYGNLQSNWQKLGRGVNGMFALAANQFVEQATSWGDMFSFLKENTSAFEEVEMEALNKHQEEFDAKYHIFETQSDRESLFNMTGLANTLQQTGYAVGAIAEIAAEEMALSALSAFTFGGAAPLQALRTAQLFGRLGKVVNKTRELEKILETTSNARKIFNKINQYNPLAHNTLEFATEAKSLLNASRVAGESNAMSRTVAKGFGAFYRDLRAVNSAVSEAKAEAAGTSLSIKNDLIAQYKDDYGHGPDSGALQQIEETALKAGQTNGVYNAYLIMLSDRIGMGNILDGFKPLRAFESSVGRGILELSDKQALKHGMGATMNKLVSAADNKWLAFKQSMVRNPINYLKSNFDEALQENMQSISGDMVSAYYTAKYNHDTGGTENPVGQMRDYFHEAAAKQFTMEGAKTFLSGFFTGTVVGSLNKVAGQAGEIKQFIQDKKGYTDRKDKIKSNREELMRNYNAIYNNPLNFDFRSGESVVHGQLGAMLKNAAQTNDKKAFHDIKDDAIRQMVLAGIRSGTLDSMTARLKDYTTELKPAEFAEAFGMEDNEVNRKSMLKQVDNFSKRATEIKELHERVSDKIINPFNPWHERFNGVNRGSNLDYRREAHSYHAFEEAKNNMVFLKDNYQQGINRQVDMLNKLASKPGFDKVGMNSIQLMVSAENIAAELDMLDKDVEALKDVQDVAGKKNLAAKKARLALLEKYHESLTEWNNEMDEHSTLAPGKKRDKATAKTQEKFMKNGLPLFDQFMNNNLKENKHDPIAKEDVKTGFVDMHDMMRLQKDSSSMMMKINLLADPKNFKTFFKDHYVEIRAMHERRVEQMKLDPMGPITAEEHALKTKKEEELKKNSPVDITEEQRAVIAFAARIANGETIVAAEDIKFQKNNAEVIEKELLRLKEVERINKEDQERLDKKNKSAEEKKKAVKTQIDALPDDVVFITHITNNGNSKSIFDSALKMPAGVSSTTGIVNKEQLFELMSNLIDGNSPHRGFLDLFVGMVSRAELDGQPGKTQQDKLSNLIDDKYIDDAAAIRLPAAMNLGYFTDGVFVTEQKPIATKGSAAAEMITKINAAATPEELFSLDLNLTTELMADPAVKAAIAAKNTEFEAAEEAKKNAPALQIDFQLQYDEAEEKEREELNEEQDGKKPDSAFSTTGLQTVSANSQEIDKDPVKVLYYKFLDKLRGINNYTLAEIAPGRRGITLVAVSPSKLFVESVGGNIRLNALGRKTLEGKTVERIDNGTIKMSDFMDSTIMVIADEFGEPYTFNENGEYMEGGQLITVNMRKPTLKDGVYSLINTKGDQLQSSEELAKSIIKAGGILVDGKTVKDFPVIVKLVEEHLQREYKQIDDIRKDIKNNPTAKHIFPIREVTAGVVNLDFNNATKLSGFDFKEFKPRLITDRSAAATGYRVGGLYVTLPGYSKEVLVVRPKVSEQVAETIMQLLTNPGRIDANDALAYMKSVIFTKKEELDFVLDFDNNRVIAYYNDGEKMVALAGDNALLNESFKQKLKNKKLNIDKALMNVVFTNMSYDATTGNISEITVNYNDFIKDNFLTYVTPNNNKVVEPLNAYIKFDESDMAPTQWYEQGNEPEAVAKVIFPKVVVAALTPAPDNGDSEDITLDDQKLIDSIRAVKTLLELNAVVKTLPAEFSKRYPTWIKNLKKDMKRREFQAGFQGFTRLKMGKNNYYWKVSNNVMELFTEGGVVVTPSSSNYYKLVNQIFEKSKMIDNLTKEQVEHLLYVYQGYAQAPELPAGLSGKDEAVEARLNEIGNLKWDKFSRSEIKSALGRLLKTVWITAPKDMQENVKYSVVEDVAGENGIEVADVIDFIIRFPNGTGSRKTEREEALEYLKSEFYGIFGVSPNQELIDKVMLAVDGLGDKRLAEIEAVYNKNMQIIEESMGANLDKAIEAVMANPALVKDGNVDMAAILDMLEKDETFKQFLTDNNILNKFTEYAITETNRISEANEAPAETQVSITLDTTTNEGANVQTSDIGTTPADTRTEIEKAEDDLLLLKATGMENAATDAQIEAAQTWWNSSPLSKHIPLKEMMNIVNSNALATWTTHGITLFNGANFTDVYHEAFHGFTQLFLTKDQKADLYNEGRVLFPGKTDHQIEEILAEDFRKYVLSGGTKVLDKRPVRNTVFRKIMNFLRELFTGVSHADNAMETQAMEKIERLYNELYTGDLINYSPSVANVQFGKLNKGIQGFGGVLSNAESLLVVSTVDSMIRTTIGNVNLKAVERGLPARNIGSMFDNRAFNEGVWKAMKIKFTEKRNTGTPQQRAIAAFVLDNFERTKEYHKNKSKYFKDAGLVEDLIDEDGNVGDKKVEGDDSTGEKFERSGNDSSIKDDASPEVLYLVSGLFMRDKQGNQVMNEMGEPKLVEFSKTWNRLIKTLNGTLSEKGMFESLLLAGEQHPELGQLALELGDPNTFIGNDTKFNLWQKFRQDLSKVRVPLTEAHLNVSSTGGIDFKLIEVRPDTQKVYQQFKAAFESVIGSEYVMTNEEGQNILNGEKLLNDYFNITEDEKGNPIISEKNKNQRMELLQHLGFYLSHKPQIVEGVEKMEKFTYLIGKLKSIVDAGIEISQPIDQLTKDTRDENNRLISKGENNNVSALLELEGKYSDDFSNYSVTNPAGDKEWEHSSHNMMTSMLSVVNDVKNFPTYQDLTQVEDMYRFDVDKNPIIRSSIWLNSLFNLETGERRLDATGNPVTMQLISLSGIKNIKEETGSDEGVKTNSLDLIGKHIFDYNTMLSAGIMELPRHEAKNSYYAIKVSQTYSSRRNAMDNKFGHLYFPINQFTRQGVFHSDIHDYMKAALLGELTRIGMLNEGIGADIEIYNKLAKNLTLFDDILNPTTKAQLVDLVKDGVPNNLSVLVDTMDETLNGEFKEYFGKLDVENWNRIKNNNFIGDNVFNNMRDYLKSTVQNKTFTDEQVHRMLNKAFTVNSWVANMEAVKFMYGDPAFYNLNKEEFHKRNAAAGATKTTMSTNQSAIDYVNSKGRMVARNLGIQEKKYDSTLGVRIYQDYKMSSDYLGSLTATFTAKYGKDYPKKTAKEIAAMVEDTLSPYTEMKESDAQGYITLDAWRVTKMLQGQWNTKLEELYLKAAKGEELSSKDLKTFFTVQKAQYYGPLKTDQLYAPAFHKFSLIPLIPSMIKGTNMEVINADMMRQGHDYATFVSGSKLGIIGKPGQMYANLKTRTLNTEATFTTNTVFGRYFGEQLKIDSKWKEKVIFSTQMRKLLTGGLFEHGQPKDFVGTNAEWKKLNDAGKKAASRMYSLSETYKGNVNRLSELKKAKLIREANLELVDGHYIINDFEKLVNIIRSEFANREMPDHIVDFIDLNKDTKKIKTSQDLSTQSQKIEGVLQSIVNNRLIRQKVNGEALIQLASSGFESAMKFRNADVGDVAKYGSNDLPFYHETERKGKKVTAAMKIKIALSGDYYNLFELTHLDGNPINVYNEAESRARLNECIKNEDWLDKGENRASITLAGVRIPVQGLNSMEFMEVYEFLPAEAGNVIIPATEIVAKSGGDFDVDKLTTYKKNLDKNGKIIKRIYDNYNQATDAIKVIKGEKYMVMKRVQSLLNSLDKIEDINDDQITQLVKMQEYAKLERDVYLNEIKDILDLMQFDNYMVKYQGQTLSGLIDMLSNADAEKDLMDIDSNLTNYFSKLQEVNKAYNEANKIIDGYMWITRENDELVRSIREKELTDVMNISEEYKAAYQARRDIEKVAENELITSMSSILELPENFHDLVTPNTTKDVEYLADEMSARNATYNPNHSKTTGVNGWVSPTRILEPSYNGYKFESNNSGKSSLGAGAIDNTFNILFNEVGAHLSRFYYVGEKQIPINIHLKHNTMPETGDISLSNLLDANGENKIADIISQMMNGWVDVGKKAWVFNLNGGLEAAPIILLLNQVGTPIRDIATFMTQPAILDYTAKLRAKNNLFAKAKDAIAYDQFESKQRVALLAPLMGLSTKLSYSALRNLVTKSGLEAQIKDVVFAPGRLETTDLTPAENAMLLFHYFQLEDLAKKLKDVKTALNFDTSKAKNPMDSLERIKRFEEAENTAFLPVAVLRKLRDKSVINSFNVHGFNIDFQRQVLPLRNNPLMNAFILDKKEDLPIGNRSVLFDKFARTFKNDFMQYILQNYALADLRARGMNFDSWFKKGGIADRLVTVKKEYPELEEKFPLLMRLVKDSSKKGTGMISIKLIEGQLDTDKINIYHDEFSKLVNGDVMKVADPAANKVITELFKKVALFGMLQSGLNKSNISWTEIIPQDFYTKIMEKSIAQFTESLTRGHLNQFYARFQEQNTGVFNYEIQFDDGSVMAMPSENVEPNRYKNYMMKNPVGFEKQVETAPAVIKEKAPTPALTVVDETITYTPTGKSEQTYTVKGAKIFNAQGKEVFSTASVDRNRIFANVAIKFKRAVVVDYQDNKYVVNKKGVIISVTSGKIMEWADNHGSRVEITKLANAKLVQPAQNIPEQLGFKPGKCK